DPAAHIAGILSPDSVRSGAEQTILLKVKSENLSCLQLLSFAQAFQDQLQTGSQVAIPVKGVLHEQSQVLLLFLSLYFRNIQNVCHEGLPPGVFFYQLQMYLGRKTGLILSYQVGLKNAIFSVNPNTFHYSAKLYNICLLQQVHG